MQCDVKCGVTVLQVGELKLKDKWAETCVPSGGAVMNPDPTGRRNGQGEVLHVCYGMLRILIGFCVCMYVCVVQCSSQ